MEVRQEMVWGLVKMSSQFIEIQTCFKAIWDYVDTRISGFTQQVIAGN